MTVERYAALTTELTSLVGDTDERLSRTQAAAQQAARRRAEQFEREEQELAELRDRLAAAHRRAHAAGLVDERAIVTREPDGSDALALLRQLLERLDGAIDDAGHTDRARAAEEERERAQRRQLEQEAARRREQAERERAAEAARLRSRRQLRLALLALAVVVVLAVVGMALL